MSDRGIDFLNSWAVRKISLESSAFLDYSYLNNLSDIAFRLSISENNRVRQISRTIYTTSMPMLDVVGHRISYLEFLIIVRAMQYHDDVDKLEFERVQVTTAYKATVSLNLSKNLFDGFYVEEEVDRKLEIIVTTLMYCYMDISSLMDYFCLVRFNEDRLIKSAKNIKPSSVNVRFGGIAELPNCNASKLACLFIEPDKSFLCGYNSNEVKSKPLMEKHAGPIMDKMKDDPQMVMKFCDIMTKNTARRLRLYTKTSSDRNKILDYTGISFWIGSNSFNGYEVSDIVGKYGLRAKSGGNFRSISEWQSIVDCNKYGNFLSSLILFLMNNGCSYDEIRDLNLRIPTTVSIFSLTADYKTESLDHMGEVKSYYIKTLGEIVDFYAPIDFIKTLQRSLQVISFIIKSISEWSITPNFGYPTNLKEDDIKQIPMHTWEKRQMGGNNVWYGPGELHVSAYGYVSQTFIVDNDIRQVNIKESDEFNHSIEDFWEYSQSIYDSAMVKLPNQIQSYLTTDDSKKLGYTVLDEMKRTRIAIKEGTKLSSFYDKVNIRDQFRTIFDILSSHNMVVYTPDLKSLNIHLIDRDRLVRFKTSIEYEALSAAEIAVYVINNQINKDILSGGKEEREDYFSWIFTEISGESYEPIEIKDLIFRSKRFNLFDVIKRYTSFLKNGSPNIYAFMLDTFERHSPEYYTMWMSIVNETQEPGLKLPGHPYGILSALSHYHRNCKKIYRDRDISHRFIMRVKETFPLDFVAILTRDLIKAGNLIFSGEESDMIRGDLIKKCGGVFKLDNLNPESIVDLLTTYGISGVAGAVSLFSNVADGRNFAIFHASQNNYVSDNYRLLPHILNDAYIVLKEYGECNLKDIDYSKLQCFRKDFGYVMRNIDNFFSEILMSIFNFLASNYSAINAPSDIVIYPNYIMGEFTHLMYILFHTLLSKVELKDNFMKKICENGRYPPQVKNLPYDIKSLNKFVASMNSLLGAQFLHLNAYRIASVDMKDFGKLKPNLLLSEIMESLTQKAEDEEYPKDEIKRYQSRQKMILAKNTSFRSGVAKSYQRCETTDDNKLAKLFEARTDTILENPDLLSNEMSLFRLPQQVERDFPLFYQEIKTEEGEWKTVSRRKKTVYDRIGNNLIYRFVSSKNYFEIAGNMTYNYPNIDRTLDVNEYVTKLMPVLEELFSQYDAMEEPFDYEDYIDIEDGTPEEIASEMKDQTIIFKNIERDGKKLKVIDVSLTIVELGECFKLNSLTFDKTPIKLIISSSKLPNCPWIFGGRCMEVQPSHKSPFFKLKNLTRRFYVYYHKNIRVSDFMETLKLEPKNEDIIEIEPIKELKFRESFMDVNGEVSGIKNSRFMSLDELSSYKKELEDNLEGLREDVKKKAMEEVPKLDMEEVLRRQLIELGYKDERDLAFLKRFRKPEMFSLSEMLTVVLKKWAPKLTNIKEMLSKIQEKELTIEQIREMLLVPKLFKTKEIDSSVVRSTPVVNKELQSEFDLFHPLLLNKILSAELYITASRKKTFLDRIRNLYVNVVSKEETLGGKAEKILESVTFITDLYSLILNDAHVIRHNEYVSNDIWDKLDALIVSYENQISVINKLKVIKYGSPDYYEKIGDEKKKLRYKYHTIRPDFDEELDEPIVKLGGAEIHDDSVTEFRFKKPLLDDDSSDDEL